MTTFSVLRPTTTALTSGFVPDPTRGFELLSPKQLIKVADSMGGSHGQQWTQRVVALADRLHLSGYANLKSVPAGKVNGILGLRLQPPSSVERPVQSTATRLWWRKRVSVARRNHR